MDASKILVDDILRECLETSRDRVRLGRNGEFQDSESVLAKRLCELEIAGDAQRYLDRKGRIAWKATPRLRAQFADLLMDAKAELKEGCD